MYDIAIVGVGAAGLAAANTAAAAGASVVVIDEGKEPGGELLLRPDLRAGGDLIGDVVPAPDLARSLARRLAEAGAELRLSTTAWGLFAGPRLGLSSADGVGDEVRARQIILATGVAEAPLPFPGWTVPGIISARAARELLRQGSLLGRRALIVGSSPDAIALALDLASSGVEVVAVVEAWPQPLVSETALAPLRQRGIALRTATVIAGVDGPEGVRAVTLRVGDASEEVAVDLVVLAAGSVPETTLPRMGGAATRYDAATGAVVVAHDATMRAADGLYVAGRVTGAPSTEAALAQGALAGLYAAAEARGGEPEPGVVAQYRGAEARAAREAQSLIGAASGDGHPLLRFLPPGSREDIVICRCEELTLGEVRGAIAAGARSQDAVKRRTRAGMGQCQGRLCGGIINALIARETACDPASLDLMTARGPARPIPLSALTAPFASLDRLDDDTGGIS